MKLLLDANLSWRMIGVLQQHFAACYHVDSIDELEVPAKDIDIWKYAKENELIIVTNDNQADCSCQIYLLHENLILNYWKNQMKPDFWKL